MLFTMGRVPTGEQSYGYSKSFVSNNNTYSAKPLPVAHVVKMKPVNTSRNTVACYGPRNQR